MSFLSTFDLIIFFGSLIVIMGVGLWAGREEEDTEDFYLGGKKTKWWGVAGSIFGSNVSANHLVGMMGVGFSVGFAQSHFEITAIVGLLVLSYLLLPVYRKLNVFTLSEYLSKRYGEPARLSYALIMVVIMIVIMMVPGFYIGSRSVNLLLQGDTGSRAAVVAVVGEGGGITGLDIVAAGRAYAETPSVEIAASDSGMAAKARVIMEDGLITGTEIVDPGSGYSSDMPPAVMLSGGSRLDATLNPGDVRPSWYVIGILIMAVATGSYTIFGGLRAVIITDVIQSVLLLGAGLIVAFVTFSQPEVQGWANMVAMDKGEGGMQRLHLYNPSNHPALPWTGVLTGLMVLHFYYWGANQFIVQRALSAQSDREARLGIITAGFFKLLIPFFSIGTGIAAWYMYAARQEVVAQDIVFITLLKDLIAPIGFGLVGLVAAGMIGAILSSLDSMMNSAATIFTFDVYKRFINPEADEKQLIKVGRICIVASIVLACFLTLFIMSPNSDESFFLYVAKYQGWLVAGVVVAFFMGMLWSRGTAAAGFVAIVAGVGICFSIPPIYSNFIGTNESVAALFGAKLNFFHTAFIAALLSLILYIVVSLLTKPNPEHEKYTWAGLGIFDGVAKKRFLSRLGALVAAYAALGLLMVKGTLAPTVCAWIAAIAMFAWFLEMALRANKENEGVPLVKEDRLWAGLLAACATFMMFFFY